MINKNEIDDLFEQMTNDAPKDGDTVDIVEPRFVSNKLTTISNSNDIKDGTEAGDWSDVRYSTRAKTTSEAFEKNKQSIIFL